MLALEYKKYEKENKIKKLQNEIYKLQTEIDDINSSPIVINPKWWWSYSKLYDDSMLWWSKTRPLPVISGLKYKSITKIDGAICHNGVYCENDMKCDMGAECVECYDYHILLLGTEDVFSDNDNPTIFDTEITSVDIYTSYSKYISDMGCYQCGGGKFASIQIKLCDGILYYNYKNMNYIEFTDDFIKEILEVICVKE